MLDTTFNKIGLLTFLSDRCIVDNGARVASTVMLGVDCTQ